MLLLIECALVLLALVLAFSLPNLSFVESSPALKSVNRSLSSLASRRGLSVFFIGVLAILARLAVLPVEPVPHPYITDEFSHLLLADTILHHRLANPTPPVWIHFETIHVIMHPTYASMYPPGQGIMLALGRLLTGSAFTGVLISVAILCAAICWALQGWVTPSWALLGGLLAVMRLGIFGYWADSYWGGAVAATGGALVLGALPRIWAFARARDAFWMALGLAILANSRPYEGFVFSVPFAIVLLIWWLSKRGPAFAAATRSVVVPMILCLAIFAAGTCYYFSRVTGSPFKMPYQVDRTTYATAPYFLWQSPKPAPVYHHAILHDFYMHNELGFYLANRTPATMLAVLTVKISDTWLFYFGPVLTLPLLVVLFLAPRKKKPWRQWSRQARFLVSLSVVFFIGLAIEVFYFTHYVSPATALIYLLVLLALAKIWTWRPHARPAGKFLALCVPLICLLMLALRTAAAPLHIPITPSWPPTWYNLAPPITQRAQIEQQLSQLPGPQLVIVDARPDPRTTYDWIDNAADIDAAKIVWARDMGAAANQELINYYRGRTIWFLDPNEAHPTLTPYTGAPSK
jgi:hypothetical protein